MTSEPVPWMGQPHSLVLRLPPLGVVYFKAGTRREDLEAMIDA